MRVTKKKKGKMIRVTWREKNIRINEKTDKRTKIIKGFD